MTLIHEAVAATITRSGETDSSVTYAAYISTACMACAQAAKIDPEFGLDLSRQLLNAATAVEAIALGNVDALERQLRSNLADFMKPAAGN